MTIIDKASVFAEVRLKVSPDDHLSVRRLRRPDHYAFETQKMGHTCTGLRVLLLALNVGKRSVKSNAGRKRG